MGRSHVLIIPFPAQGHVIPMMTLSHRLIQHGIKITFVNTDFIHARVLAALPKTDHVHGEINLVSIPDGLASEEDRNMLGNLFDMRAMPAHLEELIEKINESEEDKISYIIADVNMGWAFEVAEKMGIRRAAFCPASAGILASLFYIPKLIEEGFIDANGRPAKQQQIIQLSPTMPTMNTFQLTWFTIGDVSLQQTLFNFLQKNNRAVQLADHILCNSFLDIETSAFQLVPTIKPIGPLIATDHLLNQSAGSFWSEDFTSLSWLDQQPPRSVIYVAFGSFTVLDPHQFHELALGLELSNQPFLWVVRPDLTNGPAGAYPDGFLDRIANRGRIVGWSPQQKVLAHPSIACFFSHCGWNSTLEGLNNGVPFLCWPYFTDQFFNRSYISDIWKVGLGMEPDGHGIVTKEEIKQKVNQLLGDEGIRARALQLKESARKSVSEGGSSFKNFSDFVQGITKF